MKKIELIALVAGAASGISSYYVTYYIAEYSSIELAFQFTGIIFGIFCIPFFWYYLRSVWRVLLWIVVSGLSFAGGSWSTVESLNVSSNTMLGFSAMHAVGGAVGVVILLTGFHFLVGVLSIRNIVVIFLNGIALPGLVVSIIGLENGLAMGPTFYDPYIIILMALWQASMLYWFVHLLRLGKDNLETSSQEPQ
jgi:hypothetical protein